MKHRLVFHFYLTEDFLDNEINLLHFKCLKYYKDIFDESFFYITVDRDITRDRIREFENLILNDIGFDKDIHFVIKENTLFRESETLKKEVLDKLDCLDGLTFFAHNKGITNIPDYGRDYTILWVFALYYLSLSHIDDVDKQLVSNINYMRTLFYGGLLTYDRNPIPAVNKNRIHYAGSFFWINAFALWADMKRRNIRFPLMGGRDYSETFIGDLYSLDDHRCGSYERNYVYLTEKKDDIRQKVEFLLDNDEERLHFNELFDDIIKQKFIFHVV